VSPPDPGAATATGPVADPDPVSRPAATRAVAPAGLLQAISTARHAGYDRLVLEFGGASPPAHQLRYVDQVHAAPSDRVVPLRGKAFLRIAFQGATLDTAPAQPDPSQAARYTGAPPGSRPTFRYSRTSPSLDQGHQPWRCTASAVVTSYFESVLGWPRPSVQSLGPDVYQVDSQAPRGTGIVTRSTARPRIGNPRPMGHLRAGPLATGPPGRPTATAVPDDKPAR
jgi:hypothetical protein